MLRRIPSRLTYANVTATLALFLALGGTSYALVVTGALVQDESLTDADVRDRSLITAIADDALGGPQVADDSLGGDDVLESSLAGVDAATLDGRDSTAFGSRTTVYAGGTVTPPVPFGRYVILGSAVGRNTGTETARINCHVTDNSNGLILGQTRVDVPPGDAPGNISILEIYNLTKTTPLRLRCATSTGTATVENVRLAVLSVDDIG